jgi:hypothetical protein
VQFTPKSCECSVAFVSGGEIAWEHKGHVSNSAFFVTTSGQESIEQAIERDYQARLRGFFDSVQLPPFVFTPKSANGIGTTKLGG